MTVLQLPANQPTHNPFNAVAKPGDPAHRGQDYGWASGDIVKAAADGVVEYIYAGAGYNQGWGRRVIIRHSNRAKTTYNHFPPGILVREGQKVKAGQLLGHMGTSGNAEFKHLHFELYIDGWRVDPAPYFVRDLPGTEPVVEPPVGQPSGGGKPKPVASTQRIVRYPVRRRALPTSASANPSKGVSPLLSKGTVGNFDGFIRGERVTLNGVTSNVWYRGISGDYFWAGNFTTQSTAGLKDLGTWKAAPSKPAPKPKKRYVRLPEPWFRFASEAAASNAKKGHTGPMLPKGDYLIVDQANDRKSPFRVYVKGSSGATTFVGTPRTSPRVVTK